ncbi:MAG: type 1 glutamine amidotransferase [Jatrophihabitantaceae bacterium]
MNEATSTVLVLQLDASDPIGRLGDWLIGAGLMLEVCVVDIDNPPPKTLGGFAGLVVLGGGMGAGDDERAPFLATVRALLRAAIADEVPTLGICLGAQLLAVANGGQVAPNPAGPELGAQLVAKRSAAATDPLFGPIPITPDVVQWHFDEITVLPPGAVQLASSPGCDQQAFRLGRLAWGLQFHIETTPDIVAQWAVADALRLADYDLDRIVARTTSVDEDIAEVWRPVAAAFAAIVRDPTSVAPARGPQTATAEPITGPAAIRAALAAELTASRAPTVLPMPGLRSADDA